MTNRVTGHGQTSCTAQRSANMAQHRKARRKRRQDGLRPLEIWLPAAMIEMLDQLKRDDLSSREAVIAAIVATTLSVRSPEPSEGQPMML
ncbi:hypothetical protein [Sphingomonas sp. 28-62-20]|uniref:hypothetical protein n=1 Tax=Sphingomonas sp. 28-62-20 TaxID=1970433 RepID=UPI0035A8C0C6